MGWLWFGICAAAWFMASGDLRVIAGINAIANFWTFGVLWNFRREIRMSQATGLPESAFGGSPPNWAVWLNLLSLVLGVVLLVVTLLS